MHYNSKTNRNIHAPSNFVKYPIRIYFEIIVSSLLFFH